MKNVSLIVLLSLLQLTCCSSGIIKAPRSWRRAARSSSKWAPATSWLFDSGRRSRASVKSGSALWFSLLLVEAGSLDCTSLSVIHRKISKLKCKRRMRRRGLRQTVDWEVTRFLEPGFEAEGEISLGFVWKINNPEPKFPRFCVQARIYLAMSASL